MSEPLVNVALPRLKEVLQTTQGLKQRGLAKVLGLHESNVSRLVNGKRGMLSRRQIQLIEQYTGREYAYLADLKGANLTEDEADLVSKYRSAREEDRQIARLVLSRIPE